MLVTIHQSVEELIARVQPFHRSRRLTAYLIDVGDARPGRGHAIRHGAEFAVVKVDVDGVLVFPNCHQISDFAFAVIVEDDGVVISDLVKGEALY
ncbi:hypothetical protein D3C85_1448670 [compost metagenome]